MVAEGCYTPAAGGYLNHPDCSDQNGAGVEKFLGYTAYQSAGMAADDLCPLDCLCRGEASVPTQAMQVGCQNLFQGEVYPVAEPSPGWQWHLHQKAPR